MPASIPHDEGDEIDKRLRGNLLYLSRRFGTFYVADGYAGKPHKKYGEHPLGLAVDVVPANWDGRGCDGSWRQITRIARWAEPSGNQPRAPFRWVGYNRDRTTAAAIILHLSWSHARDQAVSDRRLGAASSTFPRPTVDRLPRISACAAQRLPPF